MFQYELALEMGIPVGEMNRRMSAHELVVEWPAYLAARAELARRQKDLEGTVDPQTFDRMFEG